MYYSETLNDYFGQNLLTDTQLECIAYNLSIIQDYLNSYNKSFAFTIAPNKNTLYPQFMPYNYINTKEKHNADNLIPYLQKYNINYINLFDLFNKTDQELYLKTDSHWNNKGALLATNSILQNLNKSAININNWTYRNDHDGDLFAMLYPSIIGTENEAYAKDYNDKSNLTGNSWQYVNGQNYEDSLIETITNNDNDNSSIYVYRDSFANALIPYFSSVYSDAIYSKLIPYNIEDAVLCKSDTVLIERAERHLNYLSQNAPILPSPIRNNKEQQSNTFTIKYDDSWSIWEDDNYIFINIDVPNDNYNNIWNYNVKVSTIDNQIIYLKPFVISQDNTLKYNVCLPKTKYSKDALKLY